MDPMATLDPIGTRIAVWRDARGLSQAHLAAMVGRSQPWMSKVESGLKSASLRQSDLLSVAQALQVTVAELLGLPPDPLSDPVRAPASAAVAGIRAALVELAAGERRTSDVDVGQVAGRVAALTAARMQADYTTAAVRLPDLLLDAGSHGEVAAPYLVEALFTARATLKGLGHVDLAREAAHLAVSTAKASGDGPWVGQAVYSYVHALPTELSDMGVRMLSRQADDLQADTTRAGLETYGMCHLMCALRAAIAKDPATAAGHLAEAADVASRIGMPAGDQPSGFNGQWFCAPNVDLWRVAVAAELGDAGEALAVRDRLDVAAIPYPNRLGYYWADLGRALASGEQDEAAMAALVNAEAAAPQFFRMSPGSVDLVRVLVNRARNRAVSGPGGQLARRLNVL